MEGDRSYNFPLAMEWDTQEEAFTRAFALSSFLHSKYRVYSFMLGKLRRWTIERVASVDITKLINPENFGYDGFNEWGPKYADDGIQGTGEVRERPLPEGEAAGREGADPGLEFPGGGPDCLRTGSVVEVPGPAGDLQGSSGEHQEPA